MCIANYGAQPSEIGWLRYWPAPAGLLVVLAVWRGLLACNKAQFDY